jgi:hypothetical protein
VREALFREYWPLREHFCCPRQPKGRRSSKSNSFGSAKNLSGFSNQKLGGDPGGFFAVLLITNYFVFFGSIGLTQPHFGSILAE